MKLISELLFIFSLDSGGGQRPAPDQAAPSAWGNQQRSQTSNAPPSNANRPGLLI